MDYLLEIGTEELPARLTPLMLTQLETNGEKMLTEQRIAFEKVESFSTPRRLVLYVTGIASRQEELVEEVKGPSKKVGYDEASKPTKAARGFARGQGVAVEDLIIKDLSGTEYIFACKRVEGRSTAAVLSEEIPKLITGLVVPRPMRWGDHELKFIRPIHWLVSLLDDQVVDFQLESLCPGRVSYGLRNFSAEPIEIGYPGEYFDKLKQANVLVDHHQRRRLIWEQAGQMAALAGGKVEPDQELLEEITHIVEYPTPLCGSFDPRFLKLPPEVVITPMREHQRYFPVWSEQGKLLPRFIAFANGPVADRNLVTEGNEKVLRARLADAEFFYQEDLKESLEERLPRLDKVVFMEGLGSIRQKVERITTLSGYLADRCQLTADQRETAERAAHLAKSDLVTSMVTEFTELQGIMGGYYALAHGEKKEVAQAIAEHYRPRYAGDSLPSSQPGAVVAIADKIDNLVGAFAMGHEPSGSQDPFALRRQALGVCHILISFDFDLSLTELITRAYQGFDESELKEDLPTVIGSLGDFFRTRLRNLLIEEGNNYDLVEAVLGASSDNPASVKHRLEAVLALRERPEFDALLTAFTRAANLSQKAAVGGQVNPGLFTDDGERELYRAWQPIKKNVQRLAKKGQLTEALLKGAEIVGPIDRFFNDVLVMVDDDEIRENRLALLSDIAHILGAFADLSKIVR